MKFKNLLAIAVAASETTEEVATYRKYDYFVSSTAHLDHHFLIAVLHPVAAAARSAWTWHTAWVTWHWSRWWAWRHARFTFWSTVAALSAITALLATVWYIRSEERRVGKER